MSMDKAQRRAERLAKFAVKMFAVPHSNYNLMLWVSRLSGAINKVSVEIQV